MSRNFRELERNASSPVKGASGRVRCGTSYSTVQYSISRAAAAFSILASTLFIGLLDEDSSLNDILYLQYSLDGDLGPVCRVEMMKPRLEGCQGWRLQSHALQMIIDPLVSPSQSTLPTVSHVSSKSLQNRCR